MLTYCNLTKETIDSIFENAKDQSEYGIGLYKAVFQYWDEIGTIDGYPLVSDKTGQYIFQKAIEFDKRVHPEVLSGGLWLNKGFSSVSFVDDWQVDLSECKIQYKYEFTLPK